MADTPSRKTKRSAEPKQGPKAKQARAGGPTASVSATEAQNNFGRVLGQAVAGEVVYITRYDRPAAVVMSAERYEALARTDESSLDELTDEFDELLASMQGPEAAASVDRLFEMDGDDLGRAARRAASSRPEPAGSPNGHDAG